MLIGREWIESEHPKYVISHNDDAVCIRLSLKRRGDEATFNFWEQKFTAVVKCLCGTRRNFSSVGPCKFLRCINRASCSLDVYSSVNKILAMLKGNFSA